MKKICFVVYNTYSLFNPKTTIAFGGAELRSTIFAKELAKNKRYDVSFIIDNCNQLPSEKYDNVTIYADRYDFNSCKIDSLFNKIVNKTYSLFIKLNFFLRQSIGNYNSYLKDYWIKKINADIYIVFGFTQESKHIIDFCKKNNKKVFNFITSDEQILNIHSSSPEKVKSFSNSINSVSKVFVQNEFQKNELINNFKIETVLLKNPVLVNTKVQSESVDKMILWVGKSNSTKRPLMFLELARLNPEKKFVMVCNNNDLKMHNDVILNLPKNIVFFEKLSFLETEKLFANAFVFVSTSFVEGFPNTFLQAAKYCVPVISLGVNPDCYITNFNCGYVCSDVRNISEKINELYNDEELRSKIGSQHFEYLNKNHNSLNIIKQLGEVIDSI